MHIWLNLLRKEWLEHKWQILALNAIPLGLFIAWIIEDPQNAFVGVGAAVFGLSLVGPCFVGMTVAASEYSQKTITFLASQPCQMWKVGLTRWLFGVAMLLIPIFVVGLVALLTTSIMPQVSWSSENVHVSFPWPPSLLEITSVLLISLNLYAWIVAIATNQRTELRAGVIGVTITIVLAVMGVNGVSAWDNADGAFSFVPHAMASIGPFCGWLLLDAQRQSLTSAMVIAGVFQAATLTILCSVMVLRYGRTSSIVLSIRKATNVPQIQASDELGPVQESPTTALIWAQWRETLPVCLAGAATAFAILIITSISPVEFRSHRSDGVWLYLLLMTLVTIVTLMIGSISFTSDLDPKLYAFWRSRPISPGAWFWLRYLAGGTTITLFFLLPLGVMAVVTLPSHVWNTMPLLIPVFSLTVYSMGVLFACTVRHPVYSIILTMSATLMIWFLPELFTETHSWSIGRLLTQAVEQPYGTDSMYAWMKAFLGFAMAGTISLVATLAAAVALKRDLYFRT